MNTKTEKPFISLGSPRGIALSSLDKYIEQTKQEKRSSIITPDFQADDQNDAISNLQREQSRLCEELNAERRRSESLKLTYSRALSLSSAQLKSKLNSISRILQTSTKKSTAVINALKYIEQLESNDPNSANTPNPSELEQQVKEAELSSEKEAKLNKAIKKRLQQMSEQKDDLNKQIEEAKSQLEQITNQKREKKESLKAFVEQFKRHEANWKEKYQALEAELEARH